MPKANSAKTKLAPKTRRLKRDLTWKSIFGVLLISALIVLLITNDATAPDLGQNDIVGKLGGRSIGLEIVDTPGAQSKGLSGRRELLGSRGMLFVFPEPDPACFWMKDMHFNIDIVWFDASKQVIYQKQNVAPASYPENFCPTQPATYVLELRAGTSEAMGLKLGDQLIYE